MGFSFQAPCLDSHGPGGDASDANTNQVVQSSTDDTMALSLTSQWIDNNRPQHREAEETEQIHQLPPQEESEGSQGCHYR